MINLAVRAHHFKFDINAPFCYCLRELIPQPSGTSWISGGAPMVFQQPMSKVWGKEEAQRLLFRDFGDRLETWECCKLHFVNLLVQHNNTLKISYFQDGALGCHLLAKEGGSTARAFQDKTAPSVVRVELAVSEHTRSGQRICEIVLKDTPSYQAKNIERLRSCSYLEQN